MYCIELCDDVIKWKHFPRYWPFVQGIHQLPVNSPHKGQWRRGLMCFFDLRLNKRLSKQSWGWWIETPSRSLWRHCDGHVDFTASGTCVVCAQLPLSLICINLIWLTNESQNTRWDAPARSLWHHQPPSFLDCNTCSVMDDFTRTYFKIYTVTHK